MVALAPPPETGAGGLVSCRAGQVGAASEHYCESMQIIITDGIGPSCPSLDSPGSGQFSRQLVVDSGGSRTTERRVEMGRCDKHLHSLIRIAFRDP